MGDRCEVKIRVEMEWLMSQVDGYKFGVKLPLLLGTHSRYLKTIRDHL